MTTIKEIIPIANQIIKDYDLCDSCLGRLFSKQMNLSSNKLLGKKLWQQIQGKVISSDHLKARRANFFWGSVTTISVLLYVFLVLLTKSTFQIY